MKGSKKFILMFASAALVVCTALFGTLAYYTDRESVANTFTVGKIDIALDEAVVGTDGVPVSTGERTDAGNQYKLVPGKTYTKDPIITVKAGSEPTYVRMLVTITHVNVFDEIFDAMDGAAVQATRPTLQSIFNNYDQDTWKYAGESKSNNTITYIFNYYDKANNTAIVDASAGDKKLPALFDSFTVPGYFGSEQMQDLQDLTITVIGQAIQAETFDNETEAWDAFDVQVAVNGAYNPVNNDANQNDASQNDASQNNASQNDASQNDASQNDASQNDVSQNDASQNDVSQNDASQNDASQNGASQNDASQNDASQNDVSQNDASQNDASQNDASQNDVE